jgi:hypothetical protein
MTTRRRGVVARHRRGRDGDLFGFIEDAAAGVTVFFIAARDARRVRVGNHAARLPRHSGWVVTPTRREPS